MTVRKRLAPLALIVGIFASVITVTASLAAVKDWSTTAATNATADATINYSEGQSPSSVNDSARAMMAAIASWRDSINYGTVSAGTVGGTGNAITLTNSPTISARTAGRRYLFKAGAGNTTAVTLVVDGLTSGAIQWQNAALVSGDIATNDAVLVEDDGTNFQLLTPPRISLFNLVNGLTADGTGATGDKIPTYDVSATGPKYILVSTLQTLLAASQAQMEAASSSVVNVTPSVVKNHPGVAKAWCMFDGSTAGTNACTAGYGVTSITRNSAGTYTANFSVTFSAANAYGMIGWARTVTVTSSCVVSAEVGDTKTTTAMQFRVRRGPTDTLQDSTEIMVQFFGDL